MVLEAGGVAGWDDMRGFYVMPGVEESPATVFWITKDCLRQSVLEPVPDVAPTPLPSVDPSASPAASAKPSP